MKKLVYSPSAWILLLAFTLATQIPMVYAYYRYIPEYRFGGFLLNPVDGNSYLAKMAEGREGNWLFQLPYSYQANKPAALFLFYLFLGNLSRWTNLGLILTFHLARLFSILLMWVMLVRFFKNIFGEAPLLTKVLGWTVFGAGMGWVGILFYQLPVDFWLAEAYPFLSALANPHFPLAIALILWMFDRPFWEGKYKIIQLVADLSVGIFLANISPFSVVVVVTVYGGVLIIQFLQRREDPFLITRHRLFPFILGSIPFLGYQLWITKTDPILSKWNAQNITPTPNLPLFIMGFIPVIIWSIIGIFFAIKNKKEQFWIPILWVLVEFLLIYLPSALQRRFSIGLYIPLVVLAGFAYQGLSSSSLNKKIPVQLLFNISIGISLIPFIILLFVFIQAIDRHDPTIYLSKEEYEAYQWMDANLPKGDLILAGKESGLFLPVYTGLKVFYGHPFESVDATYFQNWIDSFYSENISIEEQIKFLNEYSVSYILWGYREKTTYKSPPNLFKSHWVKLIYQNSAISVYQYIPTY